MGRSPSLPGMPAPPPMRSRRMSAQLAGHRKNLLIGSRVATDCDAQGLKAQASVEGCAGHLGVIQNTVAMPGALPWM